LGNGHGVAHLMSNGDADADIETQQNNNDRQTENLQVSVHGSSP
jgi:hypothetical protein